MNGGSTSNRTPPQRQRPRMPLLIHDFQHAALDSQPEPVQKLHLAMQIFLGSVKNRNASSPPSRPTPLCFMPPKGTRKSRSSQQFTQTVPVLIRSATRWARLRFCVQTLDERPYSTSLA